MQSVVQQVLDLIEYYSELSELEPDEMTVHLYSVFISQLQELVPNDEEM